MFIKQIKNLMNNRRGLSLIELIIVIALISILLTVAYQFFFQGLNIFSLGEEKSEARQDTSIASFTITNTMRNVKGISLTDKPGYTQLFIQGKYPRIQNTNYEVIEDDGKYTLAFTLTHEEGYEIVSEVLLNNVYESDAGNGIEVWYLDAAAALDQPAISVGTGSGSIIEGSTVNNSITFPVLTANIDNGESLVVELIGSPLGLSITGSPTVNNDAASITVSSSTAVTSGMYSFTVNYTGAAERMVTFFVGVNAPTITLIGDSEMTHSQGSTFSDPGATAQTPDGTDISGSIVVSGDTINSTTPVGTYNIFYNVSHDGVPAPEEVRTVIVESGTVPLAPLIAWSNINSKGKIEISSYTTGATLKVYKNGTLIATLGSGSDEYNLTGSNQNGTYTATQTVDGVESVHSNEITK